MRLDKIPPSGIRNMFELRASGLTTSKIGKRYGISQASASRILRREARDDVAIPGNLLTKAEKVNEKLRKKYHPHAKSNDTAPKGNGVAGAIREYFAAVSLLKEAEAACREYGIDRDVLDAIAVGTKIAA